MFISTFYCFGIAIFTQKPHKAPRFLHVRTVKPKSQNAALYKTGNGSGMVWLSLFQPVLIFI